MNEKCFQLIIHNGVVTNQENLLMPLEVFYEVMKVKSSVVVFREAHFDRLKQSLYNHFPIEQYFNRDIDLLLAEVGCYPLNIRYSVYKDETGWHRVAQYVPSFYPSDAMYLEGVVTKTQFFSRQNPNEKVMTDHLAQIRSNIAKENVYDFLCFNEDNQFLEGTKTNIFFVVGDEIYTAPDEMVLGGITRKVICHTLQNTKGHSANDLSKISTLKLRFEALSVSDLPKVTAACLTGTSIGVLPISKIDDYNLPTQNVSILSDLISLYKTLEANYIEGYQRTTNTETLA